MCYIRSNARITASQHHRCGAEYIGKTERILCHRIKEHKKCKTSSCCQNEENEVHSMDYENVEVIDRAESDFKLRIKELLHILKREPILNKQLNSQSNYETITLIVKAYPQHRKRYDKRV